MTTFFTRGVETASELRISLRRLDAFLSLPEPPPPSHLTAAKGAQVGGIVTKVFIIYLNRHCLSRICRHSRLSIAKGAHFPLYNLC